jgi:arylsulfatase A-like enzyme
LRQRDIILLVLDTQRADRLSCYGYERETSPNLDALARESTLFRNAVSAAQWTVPSHASMFTGTYPAVHKTVQSYSVLPPELPTLAERLRDGGYHTVAFCNNPLVGVVNNGLRRGFYSFLNYSGLLTSRPNQAGVSRNLIDRYRQWFKRQLARGLNGVQDAVARSEWLLALSFTPVMAPLWQTALSFKGNTGKSLDDAARVLIERRGVGEGQPVFSFINLMGTHMPYHPPPRLVERFAPHVLEDREARRYLRQFNSDIYGWMAPLAGPLDRGHKAILDGMYDAEVAAQDEQVGRFLGRLRESGVLDDALVIVCADHGEHLGEKSLLGHANALYNELAHVPLIVHDPTGRFPAGAERSPVISTRRVFHTVLSAAGLADEAEEALDLAGEAEEAVFAQAVPPWNALKLLMQRHPERIREGGYDQTFLAAWSDRYKLLTTVGAGGGGVAPKLYDVFDDPEESYDLRDFLPDEVDRLQERLRPFGGGVEDAAAPFPTAGATIRCWRNVCETWGT